MAYNILTSAGIGDALLAFQCGSYLEERGDEVHYIIAARDEVYKPLKSLFPDKVLIQEDPKFVEDDAIEKDGALMEEFTKKYGVFYYVKPDLLFKNPHRFHFNKLKTNIQLATRKRLFLDRGDPTSKQIFCALSTTTDGYLYGAIGMLLKTLGEQLPDYTIIFPNVPSWDGEPIDHGPIKEYGLPDNVIIFDDPPFDLSIYQLRSSSLCICADNGMSHLAYHYGIPRILLDPQFMKAPWIARWRQDLGESIDILTSYNEIAGLTKTLMEDPPTQLLPRIAVLNLLRQDIDFAKTLIYKF